MFGTNMRTVEKEAIETRIEREAQLTQRIIKLEKELEQVMKQARKTAQNY